MKLIFCVCGTAAEPARSRISLPIDKSGREPRTLTKPHRGLTGKRGNGMESGDDADRRRPDESSDDDGDESGVPAWSWDGINCGLLDCSKHGDGSIYRGTQFWHRFYHVADTRESTPPILCLSSSHTIPHLSITPCTSFIICQI